MNLGYLRMSENPYLQIPKPEDTRDIIDRYQHANKTEACWQTKEFLKSFNVLLCLISCFESITVGFNSLHNGYKMCPKR